jgi:hypothetical protein
MLIPVSVLQCSNSFHFRLFLRDFLMLTWTLFLLHLPPNLWPLPFLDRQPSCLLSLVGQPLSWLGGYLSGRQECLEGPQTSRQGPIYELPALPLFLPLFPLDWHLSWLGWFSSIFARHPSCLSLIDSVLSTPINQSIGQFNPTSNTSCHDFKSDYGWGLDW